MIVYAFMYVFVVCTELEKLLHESNILHNISYSHKKSNLEVTYYFI